MIAPASNALIIGCGFLGRVLATKLLQRGVCVYGTTRSPQHAEQLANIGIRALLVEVTQPITMAALRPALECDELDVFYLVPPGRPGNDPSPKEIVIDGAANTLAQLRNANVRRAVLTSSTAVYGQTDGVRVDADTDPQPSDARGQLLLQGEQVWLDNEQPTHVVRLAGLYGPGRVIGLSAVREGAPIVGDPNVLLNLIHVDDAAELLIKVATSADANTIELGCDGTPTTRADFYAHLAQTLNLMPPKVLDNAQAAAQLGVSIERLNRTRCRACDNTVTCKRTGWTPIFKDFREGLRSAMADLKSEA
jgi:nucleoside-diphosphate-sugar epimerase